MICQKNKTEIAGRVEYQSDQYAQGGVIFYIFCKTRDE
jgi:hypothetical protein